MNFADALGWTLVHFVWEGVLIAALFAIARLMMRRSSSNLRYSAGCAAMLLMLAAPLITLIALGSHGRSIAGDVSASASSGGSRFSDCFPVLIGIWLSGVVLLSVWSAGGWVVAQRLSRKSRRPLPTDWQFRVGQLARRVGISRTVHVFQTALTDVPMVMGWIRP